jgi:integrase
LKQMALSATRVESLKRSPGRYLDGGDNKGLYLQVTPGGASWLLRYERDGRERWMGLGALADFSLKEARARARAARQQLAEGVDPLEAKKAAKAAKALAASKAITFKDAATKYFNQHEKKWRNQKARDQFLSSLESFAFKKIGHLPVAAIGTGEVLKVLEQEYANDPRQTIWQAIPSTSNRVRRRIENILDWSAVRQYRAGENPARWKGHLENVLPAIGAGEIQKHHAALAYVELPAFLVRLRQREGVAARALEFTILTASRTSEVTEAVWSEIDLDNRLWVVPAERMKGGKEHKVPLSDRALELLRSAYREKGNEHIFIGSSKSGLSNMGMASVLSRMDCDATVHGFRSTFSTWAHERTSYSNHVIELSLAHTVGNAVERAYRRTDLFDKRRRLMAEWASYCTTEPSAASGTVVSLRRAQ